MQMSGENFIVVEGVRKSFGNIEALKGVDITVKRGQILGLLGPNGAGKTTLIRILTTLLKPDAGTVSVANIDALKDPDRLRGLIGLAGQYPAVDERLTGRENLVMVGQLYHFSRVDARQRANELLAQFVLEDAADRPVSTYSGGMRRRLDLAGSIVARPLVLFLDEPTGGLDPRTRIELWDAIRQLVEHGTTLLLTTQRLEEADALADRIVVIDEGRVIAEGTSNELKAQMGHDVLEFRVANFTYLRRAGEALQALGDELPRIDSATGLVAIAVTDGSKSLIEAVRLLDAADVEVTDLTLRRPSLDEVFLALTDTKSANEVIKNNVPI